MQQQDGVTLTIDGKSVQVPKGTLVLHAAQKLGIDIPTFCYSNKMPPVGACRMCLVSIEKQKGFPPACATPVAEGMVVTTKSEPVEKTRKSMLEFLLINHPLDCPICDKGGECPLQNLTFKFGPGTSRYVEPKRHFQKHLQIGPQIVLDRERCIVCQLCVRFMEEIVDDPQLVLLNRGGGTEIGTFPGRPLDSVFSGNVTDICPVGALTSTSYRFQSRPWDLEHSPSVCPTCPVGCNIDINTRRGQIMRLTPRENIHVDDGWLCDVGRYGTLSWTRYERVTTPLMRRGGHLLPVSWDEALQATEEGLRAGRTDGHIAGLASARSTNEELYLFARLMRGALRTPHVDTLNGSRGATAALGGASIEAIEDADTILAIDADPIARQMVLHLRLVKAAKRRGVHPVVISNEETGLDQLAGAKLAFVPGELAETLTALARAIQRARGDVPQRTGHSSVLGGLSDAFSGLSSSIARLTGHGEKGTGTKVSSSDGPVSESINQAASLLAGGRRGLILYDERVLDGPDGHAVLAAIRSLERLMADLDETPTGRVLALAKDANSRGAAEMGVVPGLLTGGRPLDDAEWFSALSSRWGVPLTSEVGLDVGGIMREAGNGELRGLFLLDSDPLSEWPDEAEARAALEKIPFLVVQTPLLTPSAQQADVILPSAGFGEESGTLTNLEGRIQSLGRAIEIPAEARDGWEILSLLSTRLGVAQGYESAASVTQEISDIVGLPAWQVLGHYPKRESLERESLVTGGVS